MDDCPATPPPPVSFYLNVRGEFTYVADSFTALTGYSTSALHHHPLAHLLAPTEQAATAPVLQRALDGEVLTFEVQLLTTLGQCRPVVLTTFPLLEQHAVVGIGVVARPAPAAGAAKVGAWEWEQLSIIFGSIRDVVFVLAVEPGPHYRFAFVNQAFLETTGLPLAAVRGQLVQEVIPEPSLSLVLSQYQQAVDTGQRRVWLETTEYPTGQRIGEVSITPVLTDAGACGHLVGTVHDLTAQKQVEAAVQALQAGKDLLQAVFDSSTLGLYVLHSVYDAAGRIEDFDVALTNEQGDVLPGCPVAGQRLLVLWPHIQALGVFDRLVQLVEANQPMDLEHYYEGDGVPAWHRWTAARLGDGAVLAVEDITPRKQAEAALLALQRQQANAVLAAEEVERRRIAEALHNGLGQLLYAAKLQVEQLRGPGAADDQPAGQQQVEQLLSTAITHTRTLSRQLIPTVLQDFGLEVAFTHICQDFSTPDLDLHCSVALTRPVPDALVLPLYRMAQTLANNVARHADATVAHLQLREDGEWLELRVDDNGHGFDPALTPPPGIGLRALRDRVHLLNGQLVLFSAAQAGTQVQVRLPRGEVPGPTPTAPVRVPSAAAPK